MQFLSDFFEDIMMFNKHFVLTRKLLLKYEDD